MRRIEPLKLLACAGLAAVALAIVVGVRSSYPFSDSAAYWGAAERIRAGDSVYGTPGGIFDALSYHYAPWFAFLWVPFTYLPRGVVETVWSGLLVVASIVALMPANRYLASLLAPFLAWSAITGNVHALMIAALVLTADRRGGPIVIGIAASLKIVPILYVVVYLGRRQWHAAGLALAVAGILWLPAFFLDVRFPEEVGGTISLLTLLGPAPFAAAALVATGIALLRPSWLTGSIAVILSLPRLLLYDFSYLLVGSHRAEPVGAASGMAK